MKHLAIAVLTVSLLALFSPSDLRAGAGAGTGFQGSAHDFSGKSAGVDQRGGGPVTTGACTFCHTPHKAIQTRLLWNHTLSGNTFQWTDQNKTVGGTNIGPIATTWSGPTKFCLSCHDGSVAIGDIAWFNRQAWNGVAAIDSTKHASGQYNISSPTGIMNGNHPVAHPFPYQGSASTYNGNTTGAATYLPDFALDPTTAGIRLFTDLGTQVVAGPTVGSTGIECTSCHGVHNESTLVQDEPLLRGTKGGSGGNYICMKCHDRN